MKIKLSLDAASAYVRRCYKHARPACGMLHNPEFAEMLRKVQGQWIDVETDFLFKDQFNTAPIAGVSDLGLRVMVSDIDEVQDDIRPGLYFDSYTHKNYKEIPDECKTGERRKYLMQFSPNPRNPAAMFLINVFPEGAEMAFPRWAARKF